MVGVIALALLFVIPREEKIEYIDPDTWEYPPRLKETKEQKEMPLPPLHRLLIITHL